MSRQHQPNERSTSPIYLVGCGGHGRVLITTLRATGKDLAGLIDPALKPGDMLYDIPILGGDEVLPSIRPSAANLVIGIGARNNTLARQRLVESVQRQGHTIVGACHPETIIDTNCAIDGSAQILAGVAIQCGCTLGAHVVVNTRAVIDHDCRIADFVFVGPGAILCGGIEVGQGSLIGAGAIILPGIRIGAAATVGAGSVIRHDVPAGVIIAGNPAREIRHS